MELDLTKFRETFFQEAAEHLDIMESSLLSLRSGESDTETLNAIFRAAHSIKAGAATFGFEAATQFTHVLESLLDRMRNGEIDPGAALIEVLLRSADVLRLLIESAAQGGEPPAIWEATLQELIVAADIQAPQPTAAGPVPPQATGSTKYAIHFAPGPELFRMGLDPFLVLRDLSQLGSVTAVADLSALPEIESLDLETCYIKWDLSFETTSDLSEIRDVFAFVEDIAEVSIEEIQDTVQATVVQRQAQTNTRATPRDTIRVSTDTVDNLIDLVGELVIAQSMAAQIMSVFTPACLPQLQAAMAEVDRHTRELQDRAMRIRMTPVGTIFSRFPRLVYDTALALGKQVTLEISGEETELDKGVVERLADPLTHLVRNAVDHGIETPADRVKAGKPAGGCLRLSAYHQGGNVIVEMTDDGRGLNTERIRLKGIERGLITADEELTPEQVHALIFRPGFSTAETITDTSGRGVGMDVVKKSVEALKGTVTLESEYGRGCTVRVRLPLTLAILDGLLLRVGDQTYVMPLISIVESIRPRAEQVRNIGGRGEVVTVRKEPLPLLRLGRLFRIPAEVDDPSRGLVVIVEHDGKQLALLVDELLGQQQVVVKSLEKNFRKVEGITGATILGDGRAALILDIAGLVAMSRAA